MDINTRWFASDNNATVHPVIMQALIDTNTGHAIGYGHDDLSNKAKEALCDVFNASSVNFVMNGTGANVYALACLTRTGDAILCSDSAHILQDECAAVESATGSQLVAVKTHNGKILLEHLAKTIALYKDDGHKPSPKVVSISQPTELGTIYSPEELRNIISFAHAEGLYIHIDGARLSNAAVAMALDLARASGCYDNEKPDIVCFGGTKNGLMFGEAIIFYNSVEKLVDTNRLQKTHLQLASKMRYIAAQFLSYINNKLWQENAKMANLQAARLCEGLKERGIQPIYPAQTNAVFVQLPVSIINNILQKYFFYTIDDINNTAEVSTVRWMASWDTDNSDIDKLLEALDNETGNKSTKKLCTDPQIIEAMQNGRNFLKSNWYLTDTICSYKELGLTHPTDIHANTEDTISLAPLNENLSIKTFTETVATRRSRRKYKSENFTSEQLTYLLWAVAGIKAKKSIHTFRTIPSGGCRHPLDLILYIRRVDNIAPGIYRYLPETMSLKLIKPASHIADEKTQANFLDLDESMNTALAGQLWNAACMFIWVAVPYRTEWVYTVAAAKTIAIDAGHACQALYGACEALDLGMCAQAAYNQHLLDTELKLNSTDEFSIYVASVGLPV